MGEANLLPSDGAVPANASIRRVIALMNAKAGAVATAENEQKQRLREVFQTLGVDAEVRAVSGQQLGRAARNAMEESPDAIVAAGGDGTISAIAGVMAGSAMPLGIIPRGTLNHFARDLSIPLEAEGAARVIAEGRIRAVDVGDVNGRAFINNSSIGIYPRMVRHRDQQRERLGRGKWLAMLFATLQTLRRFPTVRVRLGIDGQTVLRTAPFVFVGNNEYEMTLFNIGGRQSLNRGVLSLYLANRTGRWGMFRLALRALLGRLNQAKDFESELLTELWIDSAKRRLHVALDGEVESMQPPLHYRIRPGALRVLEPAMSRSAERG